MGFEGSIKKVVPFNAPINIGDTETQTWGCRQSSPEICRNNSTPELCAFVTEDCICYKPSRAWRKQYNKLKGSDDK